LMPSALSLSVVELVHQLSSGAITARQLLDFRMHAIRRHNPELNAFITVLGGSHGRSSLRQTPLAGVTIALKDNIYTKGHRTTAGSKILRNFVPSYDADVVTLLRRAGATIIGKANMHEFAFGVTNINPHFGPCRNPWKRDRISGGSSGGSAVAVASGMACAAVGTDTAGSVRIPASLCGVVGFKPTNGLISIRGIVPLAWSLDAVGFLTRKVEDAVLLASLSSGRDGPPARLRPRSLRGTRIGLPRNLLGKVEPDVRRQYDDALEVAEKNGAKLISFDFPHYREALACRSLIVHAEAASYHRRYFASRYGEYGEDLKRRLAQGLAIPAAVYLDAQRARGRLLRDYRSLFKRMDMIALPTTAISAPTIKASESEVTSAEIRIALLAFTEPFNVYGAPAISIPCGMTRDGLPAGLQLAGDLHKDEQILASAISFEKLLPKALEEMPAAD
jgi:aspartyl-tRNA(Asn)/glutamyl-tRNA(Gln) amidotransferase subunit A